MAGRIILNFLKAAPKILRYERRFGTEAADKMFSPLRVRAAKDSAVQPTAGAERDGVSGATRLQDRSAGEVSGASAFNPEEIEKFGSRIDDNGNPVCGTFKFGDPAKRDGRVDVTF